jgi:glyoxylase-like metal-dependent hydrolase (beta-lactamase superfamily II)
MAGAPETGRSTIVETSIDSLEAPMTTADMSYGSDYKHIPATSIGSGDHIDVLPDLSCLTIQIANVAFVGIPGSNEFVLVDAGMPGSADKILKAAEERFGTNARPSAIVLTHGHFDHVGAVIELIQSWHVPVFAHPLEMPFLTGQSGYPDPDPTVEGGTIAKMSRIFPHEPINIGPVVQSLPADGAVPGMPAWRWIHTPGHTSGHISLFRDSDRALIAGDAFVTCRQDVLYKVLIQQKEINGPPRYFTPDWPAARESVRILDGLKPGAAITGHGRPMSGEQLTDGLHDLANRFDELAIPAHGKYVPAKDD